jgi:hypothetical protein
MNCENGDSLNERIKKQHRYMGTCISDPPMECGHLIILPYGDFDINDRVRSECISLYSPETAICLRKG